MPAGSPWSDRSVTGGWHFQTILRMPASAAQDTSDAARSNHSDGR